MDTRTRFIIGGIFVLAGVAAWPLLSQEDQWPVGGLITYGVLAQWAAALLATGGLLLMTLGWRLGVWLSIGLGLAWLGLEWVAGDTAILRDWFELAAQDSAIPPWAVATAGTACAALAVAASVVAHRRRGEAVRPAPWLLVYSGMAAGIAPLPLPALRLAWDRVPTDRFVAQLVVAALLAVAAAIAAAASGGLVSRGRLTVGAGGAVALVAGSLLLNWFPGSALWPVKPWLFIPLLMALVVAVAVPTRRVLVLLAIVGGSLLVVPPVEGMAGAVTLTGGEPLGGPFFGDDAVAPYLAALRAMLGGLLLGVLALTAVLLIQRAAAVPARALGRPPRWSGAVGLGLVGLGVAGWAVLVMLVDPPSRGGPRWDGPLVTPGRDLRWAAGLLALGGLLLLARAGGRRLAVVLTALGWGATDLAMDSVPFPRWAVATVVLAMVLVLVLVLVRGPATAPAAGPWLLLYSGAAVVAAVQFADYVALWELMRVTSPWAAPAGGAVAALLVIAGVLTAVAASGSVDRARAIVALTAAVAGVAAVLAAHQPLVIEGGQVADRWFVDPVAIVLVLACAVVAGGIRWSVPVGLAGGLVVALAAGLVYELVGQEFRLMLLFQFANLDTENPQPMLGLAELVKWFMIGAALGLLALLPRALSTPERAPDVSPAPEPVSPADGPAVGAPEQVA